jgi:outer membrane protein TolC
VSVLQAQSQYAAADKAWINTAEESLQDYAALIKALGGGWGVDEPPALTRAQ